MRLQRALCSGLLAMLLAASAQHALAGPNLENGRQAYRKCVACHSLEKDAHRTGPSLFGLWNRKAGTADGFGRYSGALKSSGIRWNEEALDRWLENPQQMVPGNRMVFPGIEDGSERKDLIAFLKAATAQDGKPSATLGMREQKPLNLKGLGENNQVTSIAHCEDTFEITTAAGETHQFWEFNVRLKSDTSENGPYPGKPGIIPAGMRGDRVSVVFAGPAEISPFIQNRCEK